MATVVTRTQHSNKLYSTYVVELVVNSWFYYGGEAVKSYTVWNSTNCVISIIE